VTGHIARAHVSTTVVVFGVWKVKRLSPSAWRLHRRPWKYTQLVRQRRSRTTESDGWRDRNVEAGKWPGAV